MDVTIRSNGVKRRARQPIALPPANDVVALLEHGADAPAVGAVDLRRRLWIPLEFSRFGPGMPMPTCPVELTQKMAFAVGFDVQDPDSGDVIPHASETNFRRGKLYLGDFVLNGENAYGADTRSSLDIRTIAGGGIVICGMNDALNLVLMVRLSESALGSNSRVVRRDGSPLTVNLTDISAEPVVAERLRTIERDSLGNECQAVP
jgi:hypothetical protein